MSSPQEGTPQATASREGSTEAPTRHPIDWRNPDFYDLEKLDAELRRVFDICHGCRRCFNLCDSFPRLFDLIDESPTGELDEVKSQDFGPVVEACTLCDMCFMTKCPYVPPHEFDLDFPHLMLRYRAAKGKEAEGFPFVQNQLAQMDRNGTLAAPVAPLANWGSARGNKLTRPVIEAVAGIDRRAELPKFHGQTFLRRAKKQDAQGAAAPKEAPAKGRKAVLFATCFVNYNNPKVGEAARLVLAHNGVETEVAYPGCCGMPFLEQGNLEKVAAQAEKVAKDMVAWIDKGYDVITLTASCGLMFKFEWPLILPDNEDVMKLAAATRDIDEYVVDIAKNEGLAPGLKPVEGGVTAHLACHARAQNMGAKSAEMMRLIPELKLDVVERCSGHGGTFGVMKETFDVAMKVGKTASRNVAKTGNKYVTSDCPLAVKHLVHEIETMEEPAPPAPYHPIEIMARAWGLIQ
ncbi:heterodisulfide reductase-related iron-sulfur binding cluster [Parvibaculum sp.]|jgi:glycerol-3-phosphate dehydrogenase subunit C|uniref:heterodisulfide reductase-related iron-sulfur binding cluster n=1 Tax=Parvibaculum sp. TaxID=2024848 RepID=UPI000C60440D|nr:heterodisulfide reductase-related iron-sulfur binding cluster [Parvibaculum sp.]MAM95800.1 glycerol-3-phosphate dehydrogenase [Parvibaculum sp.]HCX66639.1 glycerol-3-phosphate dehydrogenase [Rhodobiaceae bacterium]|tara:strand:+ start:37573 stop:38961 length:1389 start_codon:yes stop_codon:yes gene_type:complete